MLTNLLIAFALMSVCVAMHAAGLTAIYRWVQSRSQPGAGDFRSATGVLVRVAAWTIVLHVAEILIWAGAFTFGGAIKDLATASYFSSVTYTTTGYGDVVLPEDWRLVGAVEALTGIMMCGLSTGLFFAVFSKIFRLGESKQPN